MIDGGCQALDDAFYVLLNEKIFNIYNGNTKQIEVFNPSNAKYYSQAQCAIVIERVFSRLYKYLHFKSTTSEVFAKHINIDSGYKYLTSETLKTRNDNLEASTYFDENDSVPYLRYLAKVESYVRNRSNTAGLTEDESAVIDHVLDILSMSAPDWIHSHWDLCPLCDDDIMRDIVCGDDEGPIVCEEVEDLSEKVSRYLKSRDAGIYSSYEDDEEADAEDYIEEFKVTHTWKIIVDLGLNSNMALPGSINTGEWGQISIGRQLSGLIYTSSDESFLAQLSEIPLNQHLHTMVELLDTDWLDFQQSGTGVQLNIVRTIR